MNTAVKLPGHDQSIAPIVALAANHHDALRFQRRITFGEKFDHAIAGVLHENDAGNTERAGAAIHFAHLFGFGLGEWLVLSNGLQWCVLADQYGSDYAVQHPSVPVTAFPISSVGKRLEKHESEFFQALAASIVHEVAVVLKQRRAT